MPTTADPTRRTYASLSTAYDWFNQRLFEGKLPPCLITMQRQHGAYGYFSPKRFREVAPNGLPTDEIALNPAYFGEQGVEEVLSTLVHEMVHLWQEHLGSPPRRCYHNKEWAAKMEAVGLIPSSTGFPGGKKTGQKCSHYLAPGGRFQQACAELLAQHVAVLYQDNLAAARLLVGPGGEPNEEQMALALALAKKAASKTRYTCEGCGQNAWARPKAHLLCGVCKQTMAARA